MVQVRGAIIYFILKDLSRVHIYYQYSLSAFVDTFLKAIEGAEKNKDLLVRAENVVNAVTWMAYVYTQQVSRLQAHVYLECHSLGSKGSDMLEAQANQPTPKSVHLQSLSPGV